MWYYSIFTVVMLVVFESTVVFQRLKNLNEFRSMAASPYEILCYRNSNWISIQTDNLVPGDLVSIVRSEDDTIAVPCDLLVLDGSCIVNEAMLSGESTPQLKESIWNVDETLTFDENTEKEVKNNIRCLSVEYDKGSILYGIININILLLLLLIITGVIVVMIGVVSSIN